MAFRSAQANSETSNVIILSDRRPRANTAAFSSEDAQASWTKSVARAIAQLGSLEKDWDTYGGGPVAGQTLTFASMIAAGVWRQELPKPHVSATSSASVLLEWHVKDSELLVEVHEPMKFSFLLANSNGEETTGEATDSIAELNRIVAVLLGPTDVALHA